MAVYTLDEKMTKKRWDHIYTKESRLAIDENIPKIAQLFKEANVSRVLDLGCGSGRHTIYLTEKGFTVYGIDISDVGVKTARSWLHTAGLHAVLMTGSIVELLYEDNFFDGIFLYDSLQHIQNRELVLNECLRVIKDDGVIVVIEWSKKQIEIDYKKYGYKIDFVDPINYLKQDDVVIEEPSTTKFIQSRIASHKETNGVQIIANGSSPSVNLKEAIGIIFLKGGPSVSPGRTFQIIPVILGEAFSQNFL